MYRCLECRALIAPLDLMVEKEGDDIIHSCPHCGSEQLRLILNGKEI